MVALAWELFLLLYTWNSLLEKIPAINLLLEKVYLGENSRIFSLTTFLILTGRCWLLWCWSNGVSEAWCGSFKCGQHSYAVVSKVGGWSYCVPLWSDMCSTTRCMMWYAVSRVLILPRCGHSCGSAFPHYLPTCSIYCHMPQLQPGYQAYASNFYEAYASICFKILWNSVVGFNFSQAWNFSYFPSFCNEWTML